MNHWWRAYDEAVDDPKLIMLSDRAHRAWFNLMCVSSINGGTLPEMKIVAVKLRIPVQRAAAVLTELVKAGLVDQREDGKFEPHNWSGRQYRSDVTDATNAVRQKRYRERRRNAVTPVTVTATREQIQITELSEANASGAEAPIDHRKRLFDEGLKKLATMTGKGPDACRSFVGKCLKAAEDDAVTVLGLIEEAERNQVVDPSAWIAARLKGPSNAPTGSKIIQASDDLRRKIASFDGPGDGEGPPVARLLPQR